MNARKTSLSTLAATTMVSASAIFSATNAASLRVSPILIDAGAQSNMTITLRNQDNRSMNAQVRVFKWSQKDGEDDLVPTEDVIASPPIIAIDPREDYVIRLQRTSGQGPINEEAYRIVVDELPNPDRQRNGTVAVVLRYIVPAFFFSPDATQPRLKWSIGQRDGRAFIVAENSGDKRIQLTNLGLKAGGRTSMVEKGLAGYVLGHSIKEWPLAAKLSNLHGATVVATSDHGAVSAPLSP